MAIVWLARTPRRARGFSIQDAGGGQVHLFVDLTGYYVKDDSPGMRFVPVAGASPQRILDTRKASG